jgi:putative copper resistance protein D
LTDLLAYVRAVHFTATMLAAGATFFAAFVAGPAFAAAGDECHPVIARLRRQWRWLIWTSLAVTMFSGATWLVLLAANIEDASVSDILRDGRVWTVAMETRFGRIASARLVLAVLLALTAPVTRKRWSCVAVAFATAFLIMPAWTGHAGAAPGPTGKFPLAADALHLLAAGAWIGALPPLAMLLASQDRSPGQTGVIARAVHRFSVLGMASVATLLASGIINTWYQVGSFSGLTGTSYGRLVLLKIVLFAAMVAVASINRFYLTPRLRTATAVRQLWRNTLAETTLGLAAVLAVGFLGTMAPASHAAHAAYGPIPADAAFVHIHSDRGMAEVTILPGRVGKARGTIRLWKEDFSPLGAQTVTLHLTAPSAGSGPIVRPASQDADGAWQVGDIMLTESGDWTARVDAELSPSRHLELDALIVIEAR